MFVCVCVYVGGGDMQSYLALKLMLHIVTAVLWGIKIDVTVVTAVIQGIKGDGILCYLCLTGD